VNRYAGKQYTSNQATKGQGTLFVKGIEAERRDVPRFVRQICKQALSDILVENDVSRALENCKNSIRQVVSAKLSLYEYVMTGVRLWSFILKFLLGGTFYFRAWRGNLLLFFIFIAGCFFLMLHAQFDVLLGGFSVNYWIV